MLVLIIVTFCFYVHGSHVTSPSPAATMVPGSGDWTRISLPADAIGVGVSHFSGKPYKLFFGGASTRTGNVVFAPWSANHIAVVNSSDTLALTQLPAGWGDTYHTSDTGTLKYVGAVSLDDGVYFGASLTIVQHDQTR